MTSRPLAGCVKSRAELWEQLGSRRIGYLSRLKRQAEIDASEMCRSRKLLFAAAANDIEVAGCFVSSGMGAVNICGIARDAVGIRELDWRGPAIFCAAAVNVAPRPRYTARSPRSTALTSSGTPSRRTLAARSTLASLTFKSAAAAAWAMGAGAAGIPGKASIEALLLSPPCRRFAIADATIARWLFLSTAPTH